MLATLLILEVISIFEKTNKVQRIQEFEESDDALNQSINTLEKVKSIRNLI